jgi:virulence-associated protein VapD
MVLQTKKPLHECSRGYYHDEYFSGYSHRTFYECFYGYLRSLCPIAPVFFLIFILVSVSMLAIMPKTACAIELTLDFSDFPKNTADRFKSNFPEIRDKVKKIGKFKNTTGSLFIYHNKENNENKAALILGLDLSIFGVDERRVSRKKLDLRPFIPLFLALDDYIESVRDSSVDKDERRLISKIAMSIMLINEDGDRFEFYAQTDYFMGHREVMISPNFIFEKRKKNVFMIYMKPTEATSQVFVLPKTRDAGGSLNEASLLYDFLLFDY